MKNGYAVSGNSWRAVTDEMELYEGESFFETIPEPIAAAAVNDELVRTAEQNLRSLRSVADEAISPLQAAVDIDEISDADRLKWKAWKRYLIALSKTPEREGWPALPDWPISPES